MSGNEVGSDGGGLHHAERREASRAVRNEATVNVLGVRIHSLTLADLLDEVSRFVALGMRRTVMYANVHVLNTAYGDPSCAAS